MLSFRSTGVLGRIIEASFSKQKIDTRPPSRLFRQLTLKIFSSVSLDSKIVIEKRLNYPRIIRASSNGGNATIKENGKEFAEENFDGKKLARLSSPRRIFAVSLSARLRERINAAPFLSSTFLIGIEDPLAFATICRELPGSLVSIVKFN